MLEKKSLTELRGIGQALGVPDIFKLERAQLLQAIMLKQEALIPASKVEIPKPEYDPRVMTKIPARASDQAYLEELLKPYIDRGLRLTFPEPETWAMSFGKKNDTGTLRMPPRVVLLCADKIVA